MDGTISRTFSFCAAHRIEGHPKCGRLHGHNYEVEVTLQGKVVPQTGMILDFGYVDQVVKPLVDALDHRYLVSNGNLSAGDPYAKIAMDNGDIYMVDMPATTAEYLAAFIHSRVCNKLNWTRDQCQVTVRETPRNKASYFGE